MLTTICMYRPYIDANNRVDTCKLLKFQKLGKKVRKTSKKFGHLCFKVTVVQ